MSLIHHWKLSNNANDSVGTNNGTASNVSYVDGKMGKCASFNGTSSNVQMPTNITATSGSPFTFSVWIKPSSIGIKGIIANGLGGLALLSNGIEILAHKNRDGNGAGNTLYYQDLACTISITNWTHIVYTATGTTTAASNYQLFINGVKQTLTTMLTSTTSFANAYIGCYTSGLPCPYSGLIDEVMIYDEVLTENQVKYLFNQQKRLLIPSYFN